MNEGAKKKIRSFLKKQHSQVVAVKNSHAAAAVLAIAPFRSKLASRLKQWSDADGNLLFEHARTARSWVADTAAALGASTAAAISDASEEASDLASEHASQWQDFAAEEFGAESFQATASEYEVSVSRIDELVTMYLGNGRSGVFGRLAQVSNAVATVSTLSDLSDRIGAVTDSEEDIAAKLFDGIEARTSMFVRTEAGNVYSDALEAASDAAPQKRWATIDPGCEHICHPADGQVQDMDDDFEMGDDSRCDFPPAHPNCDCTWLPWNELWGQIKSTDDIKEAA